MGALPTYAQTVIGPGVWLLEWTIEGRVFRFATESIEVDDADANTTFYPSGLGELELSNVVDGASIAITIDSGEDWALLRARGIQLEETTARLLRHWPEQTEEQVSTWAVGRVRQVQHGEQGERLTLSIEVAHSRDSDPILHPQARFDNSITWPIQASHILPDESRGANYPLVIGCPGHAPGQGSPTPVIPVVWGDYIGGASGHLTSQLLFSDEHMAATLVRGVNASDNTVAAADLTVTLQDDGLARPVSVGVTPNSDFRGESNEEHYIGLADNSTYGRGIIDASAGATGLREAGDVMRWVLRRCCTRIAIDWGEFEANRDVWNRYMVDTWVSDPSALGWDWLQSVVLPMLPAAQSQGQGGVYWRPIRWRATKNDAVGHLIRVEDAAVGSVRGGVRRVGQVGQVGAVQNEVLVRWGRERNGRFLYERLLTARYQESDLPWWSPTDSRALGQPIAAASQATFGRIPGEPIDLEHTWDEATALLVGRHVLDRSAFPPVRVLYEGAADLERFTVGDVVLLTDAELHWSERVALIESVTAGQTPSVALLIPDTRLGGGSISTT